MFVRSILALSLSCLLTGTALAASTAEQPLTPKKVAAPVEDPIDPLAVESSASNVETEISPQEQQDLNKAADTLQNLEQTESKNSETAQAPTATTTTTTAPTKVASNPNAPKASWTLDGMNNASWYENIGKGQFPVYARAHVMLNNSHASPGAIDGSSGMNTLKAIASFQQMNGIKPTGELTKETWDALIAKQGNKPAFVE